MAECTRAVGEWAPKPAKTISSYVVRVIGTEHGRWQGQVEHIPTGKKANFKSCLEMLHVMESAMVSAPEAKCGVGDSEVAW